MVPGAIYSPLGDSPVVGYPSYQGLISGGHVQAVLFPTYAGGFMWANPPAGKIIIIIILQNGSKTEWLGRFCAGL